MTSSLKTLSNGLRLYVDPMPAIESVAIGVWAQAGSVDECDTEHGHAHLLEHMAFKGTTTRSARDIAEEVESAGGYLNAATSHQRTGYYVRLLKDDIDLGLDILSDILLNPLFDEGEFAREKEVVVQEIGEVADTPDDVVFENLQSIAWGEHPLARPILGTPQTVRASTTDGLRGFMARGYTSENMVLAVSGNVDAEAFAKKAEAVYTSLASADDIQPRTKPVFTGGVRHDARSIEQTHLGVAFPGVSAREDDFFAARVFAEALGGGMSSRLFQRVREEEGLAYSVYAFSDSYDDCGLIGCYAGADEADTPLIAELFREEMAAMAEKTTAIELDRAKSMLRASMLMSLESPAARIESAAGQLFRDGRVMNTDEITERLNAVSPADIERCAARALEGPAAVSMVGPGDVEKAARSLSV